MLAGDEGNSMRVIYYYGIVSGGGCERRMGDLCRWMNDNGAEAWIVAAAADNIGLTILHGQCGLPTNRVRLMEPGGNLERFLVDQVSELGATVVDHQWWGAGIPHGGFPVPAVATLHGRVPYPPGGFYQGILSVETMVDHRFLRTLAPRYAQVWNWVDLERFPFVPALGQGAAFFGRSFKTVNVRKVASLWPGTIDCYGVATASLDNLPENAHWLGFADPAALMPKYRVIFASAQVALEAMAVGRHVIAGQEFDYTVPGGVLVTPQNVDHLAPMQFYCEDLGEVVERTAEEVYEQFLIAMSEDRLEERRTLRGWVEDHHDRDVQCGKILGFYEEAVLA